ncbi:hypothetical protein [Candidatus Accumulibacter phosphatis]
MSLVAIPDGLARWSGRVGDVPAGGTALPSAAGRVYSRRRMCCDRCGSPGRSTGRRRVAMDLLVGVLAKFFRRLSFFPSIHPLPELEIEIMKTRLLVLSALLAVAVAACGQKEDAAKAEAARLAKESAQKAEEAAKKAGAAVGAAADATKEAVKDAGAAAKESAVSAGTEVKDKTKEVVAATKEAGKEMVVKAADATKEAAEKTKEAVSK